MSSSEPKPKKMDVSKLLFLRAKQSGNMADSAQFDFRREQIKRSEAVKTGNEGARKLAAKNMLKNAFSIVLHRNRELKRLGAFVANADVSTKPDRTFFWSGDALDKSGSVEHSAMSTAQHLAKLSSGSTVEMTPGGRLLDRYAGHDNSFNYLKERFQYTTSKNWKEPQALREHLITSGARQTGKSIFREMGPELFKKTAITDGKGNTFGPLARPGSAAGALWDVVSVRFAKQAQGRVDVIHAAPQSDPYFKSNIFANSTWITKERPTLVSQGKTTIRERFAEHLQGKLQGPKQIHAPDWTGTGGFIGNAKFRSKL
ncbi:MAG: hypothetical protein JNM52_05310 [Betaproteobacteria bacterium]|nr:hypothetical protein [Betaproteobacteria bacterium]